MWYLSKTAGHETHGQSVIVEEGSGRTVALAYDGKRDGPTLAAAPAMLAACEDELTDDDFALLTRVGRAIPNREYAARFTELADRLYRRSKAARAAIALVEAGTPETGGPVPMPVVEVEGGVAQFIVGGGVILDWDNIIRGGDAPPDFDAATWQALPPQTQQAVIKARMPQ